MNLFSDYMVKFANTLDPNLGGDEVAWPEYTAQNPNMLLFPYGLIVPPPPMASNDDHRAAAFDVMIDVGLKYPV